MEAKMWSRMRCSKQSRPEIMLMLRPEKMKTRMMPATEEKLLWPTWSRWSQRSRYWSVDHSESEFLTDATSVSATAGLLARLGSWTAYAWAVSRTSWGTISIRNSTGTCQILPSRSGWEQWWGVKAWQWTLPELKSFLSTVKPLSFGHPWPISKAKQNIAIGVMPTQRAGLWGAILACRRLLNLGMMVWPSAGLA